MAQAQYADPNGETVPANWNDALDAQQEVVTGSPDLDLTTNFGHGNYDKSEFYQQIRNFRRAAVAVELFERIILTRAIEETKVKLALEGISFWDDDGNRVKQFDPIDPDPLHRTKEIRSQGDKIWRQLNDSDRVLSQKQVAAIMQKSGHNPAKWMNFYAQVLVFFHESSRSIDAELLRDFLTGIKELRGLSDNEAATGLLGGSR